MNQMVVHGKVMGILERYSCSINAGWSWLYMTVSTLCSTLIITFLSENKKYFINVASRASKVFEILSYVIKG